MQRSRKDSSSRVALVCTRWTVCHLLVAGMARAQPVSFRGPIELGVGMEPASVATGDFDGDGLPDLVVINEDSNNLSVLLGNGDGTFQTARNIRLKDRPYAVAVGDFNGDGVQDLAVTVLGPSLVSVLLGNGDGTFHAPASVFLVEPPQSIAVGDFNGDGRQDLVVGTVGGNRGTITVLLGNGDGTFQAPRSFPSVGYAVSIVGLA